MDNWTVDSDSVRYFFWNKDAYFYKFSGHGNTFLKASHIFLEMLWTTEQEEKSFEIEYLFLFQLRTIGHCGIT